MERRFVLSARRTVCTSAPTAVLTETFSDRMCLTCFGMHVYEVASLYKRERFPCSDGRYVAVQTRGYCFLLLIRVR